MGILDFLALPGQERTRLRDEYLGGLLNYYLGPTGIPERLGLVDMLNPVSDVGRAMTSSQEMLAPGRTPMERVGAGATMLTDIASVAAPAVATRIAGGDAAQAVAEGLLGTPVAVEEAGRRVVERLNQPGPVPTMYSNPVMRADQPQGIRAYHGSPHDFDRFSMDKIGTGEGAQAYGPGLYFAEAETVARGYRDQLSRPYYATEDGANIVEKYGADVADIFERSGGDPQDIRDAITRIRSIVNRNLDDFGATDVSQLKPQFYGDLASATIEFANRADKLEELINSGDVKWVDPGRMYEVNIRANPKDFIDYDAPLSAQSENVQRFANERWQQIMGRSPDPTIEGEYILKMASPQSGIDSPDWLLRGGPSDAQRQRLLDAGIPGIRYLDAGSRGAGDGSRNYVVFDENLISIIRKYGIAGAAAMLGMSQADLAQAMEQQQQPQGLLGGPR